MTELRIPTLLALLALACPGGAHAYVISTGGGGELHWDQTLTFRDSDGRIPFWIQYEGSGDLSFLHEEALRGGFRAWASIPTADLHFYEQRTDLRDAEFHAGTQSDSDKKALLFYIDEEWEQDPFIIAATLVTFEAGGRIIDADIGFNADLHDFTLHDQPGDDEVDLLSVATHEVGHFLGIGHSEFEGATMWARYEGGIEARSLSDDDAAAITYLYPCGDLCRAIVDWRPRLERGCSAVAAAPLGWMGLVALFGVALLVGRRSRWLPAATLGASVLLHPAGVPDAESTLVERIDLARMSGASDRAVLASVRSVEPFAQGAVWSRITLDVTEDLLGAGPSVVVVEQPGGLLSAPLPSGAIGTIAFGYPEFVPGEQVVVFLADPERPRVVGLAQGKVHVAPDGTLERDLSGLGLVQMGAAVGTVSLPASLDGLRWELGASGARKAE